MENVEIYGIEIDLQESLTEESLKKIFSILIKEDERTFMNLKTNYKDDIMSTFNLMEILGIKINNRIASYLIEKLAESRYPKYQPVSAAAFWSLIKEIECNEELKVFLSYI